MHCRRPICRGQTLAYFFEHGDWRCVHIACALLHLQYESFLLDIFHMHICAQNAALIVCQLSLNDFVQFEVFEVLLRNTAIMATKGKTSVLVPRFCNSGPHEYIYERMLSSGVVFFPCPNGCRLLGFCPHHLHGRICCPQGLRKCPPQVHIQIIGGNSLGMQSAGIGRSHHKMYRI